jgi:hypothetical protein
MMRKGQIEGIGEGNIDEQVRFMESLFEVAALREVGTGFFRPHSFFATEPI